jgi:hypothetical protein
MLHVATNSSTCYAFHLYYVATYILAQCICTTLQHVFLPLQLLLNPKPINTYINLPVTAPLYPSILIQFIVRYLFPTCDSSFYSSKAYFPPVTSSPKLHQICQPHMHKHPHTMVLPAHSTTNRTCHFNSYSITFPKLFPRSWMKTKKGGTVADKEF